MRVNASRHARQRVALDDEMIANRDKPLQRPGARSVFQFRVLDCHGYYRSLVEAVPEDYHWQTSICSSNRLGCCEQFIRRQADFVIRISKGEANDSVAVHGKTDGTGKTP